jgi:hypothetical protein
MRNTFTVKSIFTNISFDIQINLSSTITEFLIHIKTIARQLCKLENADIIEIVEGGQGIQGLFRDEFAPPIMDSYTRMYEFVKDKPNLYFYVRGIHIENNRYNYILPCNITINENLDRNIFNEMMNRNSNPIQIPNAVPIVVHDNMNNLNINECCVCYINQNSNSNINLDYYFQCSHPMCRNCNNRLYESNLEYCCPICRNNNQTPHL